MTIQTSEPLDERTFAETIDFIMPRAEEMKWASIPWQADLWETRQLAAEREMPIFAWMMNGSPLSCV